MKNKSIEEQIEDILNSTPKADGIRSWKELVRINEENKVKHLLLLIEKSNEEAVREFISRVLVVFENGYMKEEYDTDKFVVEVLHTVVPQLIRGFIDIYLKEKGNLEPKLRWSAGTNPKRKNVIPISSLGA